jgi:hypothetical protein
MHNTLSLGQSGQSVSVGVVCQGAKRGDPEGAEGGEVGSTLKGVEAGNSLDAPRNAILCATQNELVC